MSKKKSRPAGAAPSSSNVAAAAPTEHVAPRLAEAAAAPSGNRALGGDASVQQILDVTPKVFRLFRNASGLSAILFGYIRRKNLFKQAGYDDMDTYARQHLGVESAAMYKKIARASKAGWKYYREHFDKIVQSVAAGQSPLVEDNATLPSMTALALLSTALKSVPEEERSKFLADVLAGKIRAEDMGKRDRAINKKNSATSGAPDSSSRAQVPDVASSPSDMGAKLPPAARALEAMRAVEDSLLECSKVELSLQDREELQRQAQALAKLAADLLTRIAAE
ncbi:hypothetical protein [Polyangium jinanense]|uniref:Uncharacterized protein n=1 Tax=Polyangium jinanense TaxID=2829994 RepID=A0A9X3XJP9_9BACT|nr:hypothetical protein [Polyangium jinanense]MDC3959646.1 hypothetical protein [Polyangium jinanense]MDC3989426.1 hypothetical protein [Polyangium jinanense]